MSNYSDVQLKTKEVYVSQHKNYLLDDALFNRFLDYAMDQKSYGLDLQWFDGKTVLDAGCGNSGYFQVAMHRLGVKKCICIDIGDLWKEPLRECLDKYGVPEDFCEMIGASTTDLPVPDNSVDLVASNGVLMHLEGLNQVETALRELHRVVKTDGYIYGYFGLDDAGLMDKYVLPALREAYAKEPEFKKLIDNINKDEIVTQLHDIYKSAETHDKNFPVDFYQKFNELVTVDTVTFFQNVMQAPIQQNTLLNDLELRKIFTALGVSEIQRLPEKYWLRTDFRKYTAPMHYRLDVPIAKLLYGKGRIKMLVKK